MYTIYSVQIFYMQLHTFKIFVSTLLFKTLWYIKITLLYLRYNIDNCVSLASCPVRLPACSLTRSAMVFLAMLLWLQTAIMKNLYLVGAHLLTYL